MNFSGIIFELLAANILLTNDGKVKLCDFGVAGQISMNCAKRHSFVGTPYWMAPEIIMRAQYDFKVMPHDLDFFLLMFILIPLHTKLILTLKADIWSLGITIIELATGNPPFADQDPRRAIFLIPRSKPAQLAGNFSTQMKEFIALCLNEDPDQVYYINYFDMIICKF